MSTPKRDAESMSIQACVFALDRMEPSATARVLLYLVERYNEEIVATGVDPVRSRVADHLEKAKRLMMEELDDLSKRKEEMESNMKAKERDFAELERKFREAEPDATLADPDQCLCGHWRFNHDSADGTNCLVCGCTAFESSSKGGDSNDEMSA